MSARQLLLTAWLGVILAACGGGGPSPSAQSGQPGGRPPTTAAPGGASTPSGGVGSNAGAIDSCTLLGDAEIAAATSQTVTRRAPSTLTRVFSSVCDITLDDGGSVTVSVLPSGGKALYEASFEPYIGEENAPLDTAVAGLGDKAGQSGDDELMVLSGDVLFDVLFIDFGRTDSATVVRYLAEIILAKLPCLPAGCPGFTPPPPPSPAATLDACTLVSEAEIKTTTGFDVLSMEPQTLAGRDPQCTWTLDTQPIPGLDYIGLTLMMSGGHEKFDFWAGAYDPPLEHIPGLGDDAIKTATIPSGAIYVLLGDELLTAQFSVPLSVDDPYALVIPLIETAVSRL